jgi:hypothetical protein
MTYNEGEAFCMARGAHLVTYSNLDEQLDAESYYVRLGEPCMAMGGGCLVHRLLALHGGALPSAVVEEMYPMGCSWMDACTQMLTSQLADRHDFMCVPSAHSSSAELRC